MLKISTDYAYCQQLRAHQLQLRAYAAPVGFKAKAPRAYRMILGRRKAAAAKPYQRTQLGHGPGLQPHHHAAGQ